MFDHDLNLFSPGGADDSPNTVVLAERALLLKAYGLGGREVWTA